MPVLRLFWKILKDDEDTISVYCILWLSTSWSFSFNQQKRALLRNYDDAFLAVSCIYLDNGLHFLLKASRISLRYQSFSFYINIYLANSYTLTRLSNSYKIEA